MDNFTNFLNVLQVRTDGNPNFTPLIYLSAGEDKLSSISNLELVDKAQKFAGNLQKVCNRGDRIILCLPQGIEFFIAFFGCMYAGVISVPAFPPANIRTKERLNGIYDDCNASFILMEHSTSKSFSKRYSGEYVDKILIFEELLKINDHYKPVKLSSRDIAYLQYSSGSTGNPKGIIITHENILTNTNACKTAVIKKLQVAVSWLPVSHDMGLISMLTYFLIGEVKCYFMSPTEFTQKPINWLKAIDKFRAQYTLAPNFALDHAIENISDEECKGLNLSSLKSITCGSEKIQLTTVRNFYKKFQSNGLEPKVFCPSYGLAEATLIVNRSHLTENAVITTLNEPLNLVDWDTDGLDQPLSSYLIGNGKCVPNAEVKIVSPLNNCELSDGTEGEIWINFPGSISPGYWGKVQETESIFNQIIKNNNCGKKWLRTGDLGLLVKGELFVTGRIKDIIIIRGQNYYPEDLELSSYKAHPDIVINGTAAFVIQDDGVERLVILAEIKRSSIRSIDTENVIRAIIQATQKEQNITPDYVSLIYPFNLHKTTSGKIQRSANRDHFLNNSFKLIKSWSYKESIPKSTNISIEKPIISEEELVIIFKMKIAEKAKIPISEIDLEESLESYPIDSIGTALLAEELSGLLDIEVKPETFKIFTTIREVIKHVLQISNKK